MLMRLKDIADPGQSLSEKEGNLIMQIALPIGNGSVLMGSDVPEFLGPVSETENRSKIFVNAENKEEADRIFNSLSSDGEIEIPIENNPWGSYLGRHTVLNLS